MRTTVELPDSLMARVKRCLAERKLTFRALVISALERALEEGEEDRPFQLRDAAAGERAGSVVSAEAINRALEEQRESTFQP